jgi:hypothetical protein
MLSAACLMGCSETQISPAYVASAMLAGGAGLSGPTAMEARKKNWDCRRIERAIANLALSMQAAKERAEKEEEQMPQTLARMIARLSGPPGAGNAALTEFAELRSDADQLNELLREKGCASYMIDVDAPAFLPP